MIKKIVTASLAVAMMFFTCSCATGKPAGNDTDSTETDKNEIPEENGKIYAADCLLDENGNFGNGDSGDLTVAFIGGSLTEGDSYRNNTGVPCGGNEWTNLFCRYLVTSFPNKNIIPINSGVGGTTSDYGAMRFRKTILDYSPDIIFIEFSVNDSGSADNTEFVQAYTEYMVRAAKSLEKEPVVIFLHAPYPVEKDTENSIYSRWLTTKDKKNMIADWYGIGTVDIYDFMYRSFEASGKETFSDYLTGFYSGSVVNGFDVHGGYQFYYDAIVEALENDASSLIKHMADPETGYENDLYKKTYDTVFNYISPKDSRITRSDGWVLYDKSNLNTREETDGEKYPLNKGMMSERKNGDGILETTKGGEYVSFRTSADSLWVLYPTVADGNTAKVYIDGVESTEFSSESIYVGMNYIIELAMPGDGAEHEVKFVTNDPVEESGYLRFGYIVELFDGDVTNG